MYFLYILHSYKLNRFYVGVSHDVNQRLLKHNTHSYKGAFTKNANDWKIVLTKECASKNEALFLESFIKRMKSKIFIQKIIDNSLILNDILNNQ